MNLRKIKKIFHNPEVLSIFLKSRNLNSAKLFVKIKDDRNKMLSACNLIDSSLNNNIDINSLIEIVSQKTGLPKYPLTWYALIRKYNLETIVETGTSMGWSSFMILNALKRNGKGNLYSFDLDDSESVKQNGGVGYLVPNNLRQNWTLVIGDTKKELEPILKKLKKIDMFIHDSEHSYEMMIFEYNLAWSYLEDEGILCSDDINHSKAFEEFTFIHKDKINHLCTFQEISRPSDNINLRPFVGYFFKKTNFL